MKMTLKQLSELFAQYMANEDNPKPIRQFAAQLTLLAAHLERVEAKADAGIKAQILLDKQMAKLIEIVLSKGAAPKAAQPAQAAPSPQVEVEEQGEEDEVEAMVKKVQSETAAEAAAVLNPPQITNGQVEASS